MGWRIKVGWIAGCLGCGPVVGETDDDGHASSSDTTGTPSDDTHADPAGTGPGDPTTTLPPQQLAGDYLFALSAVIAPDTPLQWLAHVTQTAVPGGSTLEISLQPLSLDVLSTTEPRLPVGDPVMFVVDADADGNFSVTLPDLYIVGAANPITGSDIAGSITLDGTAFGPELWCGVAGGMITQPLMLDLIGSTWAATPATDPLPLPTSACPG